MGPRGRQDPVKHRIWTMAAGLAFALLLGLPLPAAAYHREIVNKTERGVTERVSVSSSGDQGDADSPGCSGGRGGYSVSDNGRFVAFTSRAGNLHPADTNGQLIQDIFVYDRKKKETDLVSEMPSGLSYEPPGVPSGVTNLCSPVIEGGQVTFPALRSGGPAISGNGRYVAFTSNLPLTGNDDDEAPPPPVDKVFVRDLKNQTTRLVSRTQNGAPAVGESGGDSISDSGRFVAFTSEASNMVDEDVCPATDLVPGVPSPQAIQCGNNVYVRDLKNNETSLVSKSTMGEPTGGGGGAISGNGRFVAFGSSGENNLNQVFVHDRNTGETELISVSRDGGPGDNLSTSASISHNGRFIGFNSHATDLVPANPPTPGINCLEQGYVRDRKTGRTERVTVTTTGSPLTEGHTHSGSFSADGRYALIETRLNDVVARTFVGCPDLRYTTDDSHNHSRYVLHDRETGQLDWIATEVGVSWESGEGSPPEAWIDSPVINADARVLVGSTDRSDVVKNDSNDARDVFVRDIGNYPLGTGPLGGSPSQDPAPPDEGICVAPGVCVPPGAAVSSPDTIKDVDETLTKQGANLYGASLAYRPELGDLFAAIELEHMGPSLTIGPAGIVTGGNPWILYGLRFTAQEKSYEVRATSLLGGTFGLFDCTETASSCTQVASLRGGYGTTGERVVVSLPLDELGLEDGGRLTDVEAFSGLGSHLTGATQVLDSMRLK